VNALWRVVVKEFLQLRQDRKMIPVLLIGPLVQLLALSYAANLDVSHIPLVVVDHDRTVESRSLVQRFTSSGWFDLAASRDSVDAAEPLLVDGRAQMALVVAAGYGRELQRHGRPAVQVIADGSDSNSAVVGLGYASRIVAALGADLVAERQPRLLSGARIELRPRIFYNPDLRSRWFYVPAVLAMVLMLVTMILPSMAVVREKEIGTLEQIIVTPLRPWQLIAGKLLPFVVIGIVDQLLICALAVHVLDVPLRGSLVLLTGLTLLFLLCTLGLGLFVSSVVATQQQAMMFCIYLLMVPMIYLSGLIFPIENMPAGFQYATYLIPVRYYANILRGVFLKGSGIDVLWPDALALLAIGSTVLTFAALRFRKNLD
jgi:ABC-2 type transport system permease protein